jgi:hypothetical protein
MRRARCSSSDAANFFRPGSSASSGQPYERASVPLPDVASIEPNSTPRTDTEEQDGQPLPDNKWYPGLVIYAITNVGFLRLWDFCSGQTVVTNLMVLAAYYAAAFVARLVMTHVIGLSKSFPQFFWEGVPKRTQQ